MKHSSRAWRALAWTSLALTLTVPATALAFETNVTRVPRVAEAENDAGLTRPCITCHNNADGGTGCTRPPLNGTAPCLNPFGEDFDDNRFTWDATLALMDSDNDGFTNGQELQDPDGTWRPGQTPPGIPEGVTRPGFATDTPGDDDGDSDGYCFFGEDLAPADGDCLDAGENNGELDCNDADANVNSGAMELCTNVVDDNCDGLPTVEDPICIDVVDRDGDGFCLTGADVNGDGDCLDGPDELDGDSDCDDTLITVAPDLRENCFDELDNNCNDLLDTDDPQCRADLDEDGDGYCPIGRDLNEDGDCLDPDEVEGGFDCNDTVAEVNPDAVEICADEFDNDCDGNANFDDEDCIGFFDADGDGFCPLGVDRNEDQDCVDEGEDVLPGDCVDDDPDIRPDAPEICNDTTDTDCDGLVSLEDPDCEDYLDGDGDRYCLLGGLGTRGGFDLNRDGDCVDANEEGGVGDCRDDDPAIRPGIVEICIDNIDNDCNGSLDALDEVCAMDYLDFDGDGWCAVGPDLNLDGDCSDSGEQAEDGDSAPNDPTIYPGAPENCTDFKDNDGDGLVDLDDDQCVRTVDADGDGWCPFGDDLNGDGDCTDENEVSGEGDCDDSDPDIHPGVTELCFNRRDDNCDGRVNLDDNQCFGWLDRDGDGFCPWGTDRNLDGDCRDEAEPAGDEGTEIPEIDCDDRNASIGPRATEICDDGVDNDCDDQPDLADLACPCTELCDDGNPCTTDDCNAEFMCVNEPIVGCGDAGPMGDGGVDTPAPGGCSAAVGGTAPVASCLLGLVAILMLGRRRRRLR